MRLVLDVEPEVAELLGEALRSAGAQRDKVAKKFAAELRTKGGKARDKRTDAVKVTDLLGEAAILEELADVVDAQREAGGVRADGGPLLTVAVDASPGPDGDATLPTAEEAERLSELGAAHELGAHDETPVDGCPACDVDDEDDPDDLDGDPFREVVG